MRNKIYQLSLILTVCYLTPLILSAETETETIINPDLQTSKEAAEEWLKLLDQKNYDQSWDKGAATLQLLIPKKDWRKLMESIHRPMGEIKSRQIIEQRPAKDPVGLPKGEYMVLVYKSSFSAKPTANELLTMVKESDGRWKILTYQVK
jgi:hypothetical protein